MRNRNQSCVLVRCHDHACEVLVTLSATACFPRRKINVTHTIPSSKQHMLDFNSFNTSITMSINCQDKLSRLSTLLADVITCLHHVSTSHLEMTNVGTKTSTDSLYFTGKCCNPVKYVLGT